MSWLIDFLVLAIGIINAACMVILLLALLPLTLVKAALRGA